MESSTPKRERFPSPWKENRGEREFTGKIEGKKMTGEMSVGGGRFQIEFEAERKSQQTETFGRKPDQPERGSGWGAFGA